MLKKLQLKPCTGGTSLNSKMATSGGSIASELLDAIKLKNYGIYVNKLNSSDEIRVSEFHASAYALEYVLDTRLCFNGNKINPNHVFEIFGEFSGSDHEAVKLDMLNKIACNFNWYRDRAEMFLQFKGQTLKGWLEYMCRKGRRCNELGIYVLSVLYDRHTVVFGRGWPWCTIQPTGDPSESDFAKSCDLHLLYVGDSVFAPLTPRRNDDNSANTMH